MDGWRVGVVGERSLELPHVLPAPDTFSGLGHLHHVVVVARLVLRFGAQVGEQLGEELPGPLLVQLFQVGNPWRVHPRFSFCSSANTVRLVLEERAQAATSASVTAVGVFGDGGSFGGLYKDPSGAFEGDLERFAATAAGKGFEGDVAPDSRPHAAAPGYGGLGVGEGGGRGVEEDGLAVGSEGDLARAFQDDVVEAAGQTARALDPLDVPVDASVEGEDIVAVHGHAFVFEVEDHDLALVLRQEQVADSGGHHQLDAFAGHGLLEEPPQAPALVLEADVALVGDHRAELGLDLVVLQPHFEHRRVLEREPPLRRNLPKLLQVRLTHRTTSLSARSKRYYLGTKRPSRSFLEHLAARRNLVVRGEEHDLAALVRHSQDEHLALEASDPLGRKIDHGDELPAHEPLRLIERRDLGAGLPGPDFRSEVQSKSYRGLACLREGFGLDDRADPHIHLLEVFPADLGQSTLLLEISNYRLQPAATFIENRRSSGHEGIPEA